MRKPEPSSPSPRLKAYEWSGPLLAAAAALTAALFLWPGPDGSRPGNCSTFMLEADSVLLVGHNLDETPGFHVPGLVCINKRGVYREGVSYRELVAPPEEYERMALPFARRPGPKVSWISRYGSVSFNTEGVDFPDGGVNEKGLAIFEMSMGSTEYPREAGRPEMFMMLWVQYVLDNFDNVGEVIESTGDFNLDGWSWHYFVSDAAGKAAVIEFLQGRPVVHTGQELRFPVLCNSSYSAELKRYDDYGGFADKVADLIGKTPRFVRGARMISQYDPGGGKTPREYAAEILDRIAIRRWNKWKILVDVRAGRVWFNTEGNRDYRHFSLEDFDLAAGGTEILDMYAPGSGDVSTEFEAYTYERDLEHLLERAGHLFEDRFSGMAAGGVTAGIYARRFADYSRRIRSSGRNSLDGG